MKTIHNNYQQWEGSRPWSKRKISKICIESYYEIQKYAPIGILPKGAKNPNSHSMVIKSIYSF